MASKDTTQASSARITESVRAYGLQKALAQDVGLSDTELSRVLHEQMPKILKVLGILGLEVVPADHVADLRRVLKEYL